MKRDGLLLCLLADLLLITGCGGRFSIDESKLVDLTHPFNEDTVYWPTEEGFRLERRVVEEPWYAANTFCSAEHGGTHIDAPVHFARGRWTTAEIPIQRLIGPARVIDVREACARDADYLVMPADIIRHEERHGPIDAGDIVLVRTGWGARYGDPSGYLGSETLDPEDLHFPGLSAQAAALLVETGVDCVGIDTASIDHGPSRDFAAHRVLNGANVPVLENIARLEEVPAIGAIVIALPMKIDDGTGGPCRIVALLP